MTLRCGSWCVQIRGLEPIVGNEEVSSSSEYRVGCGGVAIIAEPVCQKGVLHGILRIPVILQN